MNQLEHLFLIAQTQPIQPAAPLIDRSAQHLIYIAVGGIVIVLAIIIGLFSRRLIEAIVFSLVLSAVVMILIMVV